MKPMKKKKNMLGPIVLLSTISLVSVGFASWVLTAGDEVTFEGGNLKVETVNDYSHELTVTRIRGIESETGSYDLLRKDAVSYATNSTANAKLASYTNTFIDEANTTDRYQEVGQKNGGGWNVNYSSNRSEVLQNSDVATTYDDDHNVLAETIVTRSFYKDNARTVPVNPAVMAEDGEGPAWTLQVGVGTESQPREDVLFYFLVKVSNVDESETPASILGDITASDYVLTVTDNNDATNNYAAAKTTNLIANPTVSYAVFDDGDDLTEHDAQNSATLWYSDSQYDLSDDEDVAKKAEAQTRSVIIKVSFPWGTKFNSKNPMDYVLDNFVKKIENAAGLQAYYESLHEGDEPAYVYNEATVVGYMSSEEFTTAKAAAAAKEENERTAEEAELVGYADYDAYKAAKIEAKIAELNIQLDIANKTLCGNATKDFDALEKDLEGVTFKLTFSANAKPQA